MPSIAKGVLVGIATTVLIALLVAMLESSSMVDVSRTGMGVMMVCLLPGTLIGLLLGCVAGHVTRRRRLVLVAAGTFTAAVLCGFRFPGLFFAVVGPTVAAMVCLEYWTRSQAEPMAPVWRGAALGVLNIFVIAVLFGVLVRTRGYGGGGDPEELGWTRLGSAHEAIQLIALFGLVPAFGAGAAIGAMAGAMAGLHRWVRFALLAAPAMLFTAAFGAMFDETGTIVSAWIPTLVCVAIVERWTRRQAAIPFAVAV
jgi:hypothetical protein